MKIGIPKEILQNEERVAITPGHVADLTQMGHDVIVEKNAGTGSGFSDEEYSYAGAQLTRDPSEAWAADLVVKVKEPQTSEFKYLRSDLILFTYLHLANHPDLTQKLLETKTTALAYETVEVNGSLPLLTPMSEVAGSFAVQAGAQYLESKYGGKGVLLGSVPGVRRGKVVIIGGGTVGANAAKIAIGLGARVVVLDTNARRLTELENIFGSHIETLMSDRQNIAREIRDADVVIGSVLVPGGKAPVLVTEEMVKSMEAGSVIVDISIDQGGNFETSTHATSHSSPIYTKHGVIHYTVANIPGAVPRTSAYALTNATMPYVKKIAQLGLVESITQDPNLKKGVNTYQGHITHQAVADSFGTKWCNLDDLLRL